MGLQGKHSAKDIIAHAANEYGVEAGGGSLKEQVGRIARELDIQTGW